MTKFQQFCGFLAIVGPIDGTHVHIQKSCVSPKDYLYFKSLGYTMQMQVVVDR